jgi:hypothetical protein
MKPKMIPAILLFLLLLAPHAYSMSSAGYRLDWFTPLTTGGGGASGSPSYAVNITVGQSVIGSTASTGYKIGLGYWVQQLGSLAVMISPQGAIDVGAQWRRVGTTTWLNSGSTESDIPEDFYTVEFKAVTGWASPSSVGVTISNGVTTTISRSYVPTVPAIQVTPSILNFGYVPPGSYKNLILVVRNIGGGILTGTVSACPTFSIVSGGNYSLGVGESQQVIVRYTAPSQEGAQTCSLVFTGGGGVTIQAKGTNEQVGLPWLMLLLD